MKPLENKQWEKQIIIEDSFDALAIKINGKHISYTEELIAFISQLLQQTKLETVEECKVGRAKEIMEAVRVSKQQTLKEVEEKLPPRATLRGNLNFSPSSFNDCLDLCHQVINNMKDND